MSGKNYSCANTGKRNEHDFYQTPYKLTKALIYNANLKLDKKYIDPACGNKAIIRELYSHEFDVFGSDKYFGNKKRDYLIDEYYNNIVDNRIKYAVITNPPYSGTNKEDFVKRTIFDLGIEGYFLLPLGFLQGQKRYNSGIYNHLKTVYIFTRMPMLEKEVRADGKFKTGMQAIAWFHFVPEVVPDGTKIKHISCEGMTV